MTTRIRYRIQTICLLSTGLLLGHFLSLIAGGSRRSNDWVLLGLNLLILPGQLYGLWKQEIVEKPDQRSKLSRPWLRLLAVVVGLLVVLAARRVVDHFVTPAASTP